METSDSKKVPCGTYTIINGDNHVTIRLKEHWEPAKAGQQVAEFLSGPDNESDYTGFAFVVGKTVLPWRQFIGATQQHAALKVLLSSDWRQAGEAYAIQSGNCYKCGRKLTTPASLCAGLGPVCAGRMEEERAAKVESLKERLTPALVTETLDRAIPASKSRESYFKTIPDDYNLFDESTSAPLSAPSMRDILGPGGVIAQSLPGYEVREAQLQMAELVAEAIRNDEHAIVEAGTGCIYGDAEIVVNRGGLGRRFKLKDMVAKFNGAGVPSESSNANNHREYRWDLSIPTYVQREVNGVLRLALLLNAWCSGLKQTYVVTTDSGRTIRATDEHPFLTERGWLRLDELHIGDEVHVAGQQASKGRQVKPRYTDIYRMKNHPFAHYRKNGRSAAVARHRLIAEAELNSMEYEPFVRQIREGDIDGLKFLDPSVTAVHHDNHIYTDDAPGNLAVLTRTDHARLHAESGTANNVLYKVKTERVASVTPYGIEMTYDLEVADAPHNFIVNGFVVHNTGKSLAYLIPAIYARKRTIVSTGDKNLQDQLWRKDLPFLRSVLPVTFAAAILKGKNNYICIEKLDEEAGKQSMLGASYEWTQLQSWLKTTESGDIEELPFALTPELQGNVTSTSDACLGKDCPSYLISCFAERAKTKAEQADIIVVNHALLALDVALRANSDDMAKVLPDRQIIVIDEAHRLEDAATLAFTTEISVIGIMRLLNDKQTQAAHVDAGELRTIEDTAENFFTQLAKLNPGQSYAVSDPPQQIRVMAEKLALQLAELARELKRLNPYLDSEDSKDLTRYKKHIERVHEYAKTVESVLLPSDLHVVYVEKRTGKRGQQIVYLKRSPISVAEELRAGLFEVWPTICTSATMATGKDFSYFKGRVGCDQARELIVDSPFDYKRNAMIYLPMDGKMFDPTRYYHGETAEYFDHMSEEIEKLLLASDGRAFCLFTSNRALNEIYQRIAHRLQWFVLKQGEMPRQEMVKQFKKDGRAVLFGTRSFFEGIDVQGEALSLVIIDKLPFGAPDDPIYQARCDAITKETGDKWSWFNRLALPTAIITLKQGFGRLIRTKGDKGVVCLLDGRLSTKNYGSSVIRSLPPGTQTRSHDSVKTFFAMMGDVNG